MVKSWLSRLQQSFHLNGSLNSFSLRGECGVLASSPMLVAALPLTLFITFMSGGGGLDLFLALLLASVIVPTILVTNRQRYTVSLDIAVFKQVRQLTFELTYGNVDDSGEILISVSIPYLIGATLTITTPALRLFKYVGADKPISTLFNLTGKLCVVAFLHRVDRKDIGFGWVGVLEKIEAVDEVLDSTLYEEYELPHGQVVNVEVVSIAATTTTKRVCCRPKVESDNYIYITYYSDEVSPATLTVLDDFNEDNLGKYIEERMQLVC